MEVSSGRWEFENLSSLLKRKVLKYIFVDYTNIGKEILNHENLKIL